MEKIATFAAKIDGIAKETFGSADVAIVEELNMPLALLPDVWPTVIFVFHSSFQSSAL